MKVRIFKDDWYMYCIQPESVLKIMHGEDLSWLELTEVPKALVDEYNQLVIAMDNWQQKIKEYDSNATNR